MAEALAVGWAVGLGRGLEWVVEVMQRVGLHSLDASYPAALDHPEGIETIQRTLAAGEIEFSTVICGFGGDDWSDIPAIFRTVGLSPPATRAQRLAVLRQTSRFARKLGIGRLSLHVGRLPEPAQREAFGSMVQAMRGVCEELAEAGQVLAMETGQEPAKHMREFIEAVDRPNLHVSFDPANFLLYGQDRPLAALEVLAPWVDGVHCKDGCWPQDPKHLGLEKRLGEGDIDFEAWLRRVLALGYRGPLTIETGVKGEQLERDVIRARAMIERVVKQQGLT
jgi:sugar phosphate isomerase/epimerase